MLAITQRYEMALNFRDLRVLSLSDGLAHDTLSAVTLYLRQRTSNGAMARPIFSLLGSDATEAFALTMALTSVVSKTIQERWNAEKDYAQQRVEAHWKAVQDKKKAVENLRSRLAEEENALWKATIARDSVSPRHECRIVGYHRPIHEYVDTSEYKDADSEVTRCQTRVDRTKKSIIDELKAPLPVIQPLPSSESKALSVLFLLYMPESMRSLANLSFAAQEALLPQAGWNALTPDENRVTQTKRCDFDWISHHASQQNKCVDSPSSPNGGVDVNIDLFLRRTLVSDSGVIEAPSANNLYQQE
jgi:hypothetical protein